MLLAIAIYLGSFSVSALSSFSYDHPFFEIGGDFIEHPLTSHRHRRLVFPEIRETKRRRRRDINRSFHYGEEVRGRSIKLDDDWLLDLDEGEAALDLHPDFRIIAGDEDGKLEELDGIGDCRFYSGKIRGFEDVSFATVTICGGEFRGYVRVGDDAYLFEPFNISSEFRKNVPPHVLYRPHDRFKRWAVGEGEKPWEFFNLTGDTLEFEDEVDEDQLHQQGRSDNSTGDDVDYGLTEPEVNITLIDWNAVEIDQDITGYFVDHAWESTVIKRKKFDTMPLTQPQWLEIALAVDHTVINFHGKDRVKQYVLSLMNIVNAIYQDPSLDANLQLVVTRLFFYETRRASVIRLGDAKRSLQNVNAWNRRLHAALSPDDAVHDIAVWLTRADIGGPSGYAPVSGVCDPKRSCTLNRDEGLTSAFIIAHEIAHTLGLTHDGEQKAGNTCGGDAFYGSIMAPMVSSTFHKFVWSDCSKREYHRKTSKLTCLLNPPPRSGEIILNNTLQSTFSLDEQCRMEFGDGYSLCRSFDIIDTCSHLWCGHHKSPVVCKTKKGPPLEGTECGFDKWCINGFCEQVDSRRFGRDPVHHNPQNGDWNAWGPWGPCSRSCGTGVEFRMRKCDNPPPMYGGNNCAGEAEEWRVCTLDPCPEPMRDFRAQQCARLPELLNFENTRKGNMTWLPFESDEHDSKCKLICISKETRELYVTDENLMDGTPCSYESNSDICIQGACYNLGCDGVLYSNLKLDACGVCGGNNSECQTVRSSYNKRLRREVSRLVVVPRLARRIRIEANFSTISTVDPSVAFLIKDRNKQSYSVSVPNKGPYGEIIAGTKFHYQKFGSKNNIWANGPSLSEIVIALFVSKSDLDLGINISFRSEYFMNRKLLKDPPRFAWVLGGWGACSQTCGGGKRQKTAACFDTQTNKIVPRRHCSLIIKPYLETETCNAISCSFQWAAGAWEPCSKTCGSFGVQYREVYCVPQPTDDPSSDVIDPWNYMVSPGRCGGLPPVTARPCNRVACPVDWSYGEWSQCSTSCGPGVSTRQPRCVPPEGEQFFSCGFQVQSQKKVCRNGGNNSTVVKRMCKRKGKKRPCFGDVSAHCSLPILGKYCKFVGFRKICCDTCSKNKLSRIIQ